MTHPNRGIRKLVAVLAALPSGLLTQAAPAQSADPDRRGADRIYLNVAGVADGEIGEAASRLVDCLRDSCGSRPARARRLPAAGRPLLRRRSSSASRSRKER